DHGGPAEHALRAERDPRGPRLGRDGRGPLPAGPVPRCRLGGGPDPSAAVRLRRVPIGDHLERRAVRGVDRHVARNNPRRDRGAPTGPSGAPLSDRKPTPRDARRPGWPTDREPVRRLARTGGGPIPLLSPTIEWPTASGLPSTAARGPSPCLRTQAGGS